MDSEQLKQWINALFDLDYKSDLLQSEKKKLIEKIIPIEIQMELESLEAEFADKEKALEEKKKVARKLADDALAQYLYENPLKTNDALKIKSELGTWTITPQKPVYNPDWMDKYAVQHPEILDAREEQAPKTRLTKNRM